MVERKHRHLLEVARALFFQFKLPIKFWGDCVQTATYIINRSPLASIGYTTPYEKLFGDKPSYDHMKAFGCLLFVSTLKQGRSKFDARAHPCVFIGYPFGQKAYKAYDLISKKTIISRDIKFHEHHFPFHFTNHSLGSPFFVPVNTPIPSTSPTCFDVFPPAEQVHPPSDDTTHLIDDPSHSPPLENIDAAQQVPRRSTRTHNPPSHLKDYICTNDINAHWCNLVNIDFIPNSSDLHNSQDHHSIEPTSYKRAVQDPNWVQAMNNEL